VPILDGKRGVLSNYLNKISPYPSFIPDLAHGPTIFMFPHPNFEKPGSLSVFFIEQNENTVIHLA